MVSLVRTGTGNWEEHPRPEKLPSNQATILEVHGNIFFASVYSFDELLPTPDETSHAVLILRVRDRRIASLTGLDWLEKYHDQLEAAGNKLMFSGVGSEFMEVLEKAKAVERLGAENIFPAETEIFASTEKALKTAQTWIEENQ